jgi:hypothetical protein
MTMTGKGNSVRPRSKRLELDEALIDARERRFLRRLAVDFNIRAGVASRLIEAMLVKNHL